MKAPWISSAGGALILVPKVARGDWRGSEAGADDDENATDYARTWEVSGLVGTIPWQAREVLVFSEPAATIVRPRGDALAVVQWFAADDEAQFWAAIDAHSLGAPDASIEWTTEPGEHLLFDAAASSDIVGFESRSVHLAAARYRVDTHDVQPQPRVRAFVHVLTPIR